ncbi:MAG: hypothetical protein WBV22_12855 [Anaerolineaceae bacterium]
MLLTIQYLEDASTIDRKTPAEWAELLDRAFNILPLTHVLMGWKVPPPILQACDNITSAHMARLYRWHPLLTGDGGFTVKPDWRVIGLDGNPVPASAGGEEFSFICPNHPEATEIILDNLKYQLSQFDYQGVFLDRIRYPSPVADAINQLGCFCKHCQKAAAQQGVDLIEIRRALKRMASNALGTIDLTLELVGWQEFGQSPLSLLLAFRQTSITKLIERATDLALDRGLEVGLDCFTPSLARMVGQDLVELSYHARWIKLMTYAHTLGPAGLPFELLGLIDTLTKRTGLTWPEAAGRLSETAGFRIPDNREELVRDGLPTEALVDEMRKVEGMLQCTALAGVELVDLQGITHIDDGRLEKDLSALTFIRTGGLALSWDLQSIPMQRLELVNKVLFG